MTATSFDTKNYTSLIAKGLDAIEFTPSSEDEISPIEEALQSIVKSNNNHIVPEKLKDRVEWLRQFKEDYLSWGVTESQKDLFIKLVDNLIQQKIEEVTDLNLLPRHQHYHEQQKIFTESNLKEKKEHDDLTLKKQAEIAEKNKNTPLEANIKKLIAKGFIPEADINQAYTLYNLEELDVYKNDQVVDHILAGRICIANAYRLLKANIAKLVESGILTVEDVEKLDVAHTKLLDIDSVATLLQDKKIQLNTVLKLSVQHIMDLFFSNNKWNIIRELALIESNDSWLRGITTYAVSILGYVWVIGAFNDSNSSLLEILISSWIMASIAMLRFLPWSVMEPGGFGIHFERDLLAYMAGFMGALLSFGYPVFLLLAGRYDVAAALFLVHVVSTAIFTSFSWYRECQADNFANQNATARDLYLGQKYLQNIINDRIQDRTESLWYSFIYNSEGNNRFDFFHPTLTSRISKIDQAFMSRVKNIQNSNPKLCLKEVFLMLVPEATS